MQGQPGTHSSAKVTRSKVKDAAAEGSVKPKASRARKKATPAAAEPEVTVLALYPTPDEITGMIATAAYYFAAERNFAAGHELDDWLRAEQLVRGQLSG